MSKYIQKRAGHRHFYDVVDRHVVRKIVDGRITYRTIRIRQCACGEVGYEIPGI